MEYSARGVWRTPCHVNAPVAGNPGTLQSISGAVLFCHPPLKGDIERFSDGNACVRYKSARIFVDRNNIYEGRKKRNVDYSTVDFEAVPTMLKDFTHEATCVWTDIKPSLAVVASTLPPPKMALLNEKGRVFHGFVSKLYLPDFAFVVIPTQSTTVRVHVSNFDGGPVVPGANLISNYLRLRDRVQLKLTSFVGSVIYGWDVGLAPPPLGNPGKFVGLSRGSLLGPPPGRGRTFEYGLTDWHSENASARDPWGAPVENGSLWPAGGDPPRATRSAIGRGKPLPSALAFPNQRKSFSLAAADGAMKSGTNVTNAIKTPLGKSVTLGKTEATVRNATNFPNAKEKPIGKRFSLNNVRSSGGKPANFKATIAQKTSGESAKANPYWPPMTFTHRPNSTRPKKANKQENSAEKKPAELSGQKAKKGARKRTKAAAKKLAEESASAGAGKSASTGAGKPAKKSRRKPADETVQYRPVPSFKTVRKDIYLKRLAACKVYRKKSGKTLVAKRKAAFLYCSTDIFPNEITKIRARNGKRNREIVISKIDEEFDWLGIIGRNNREDQTDSYTEPASRKRSVLFGEFLENVTNAAGTVCLKVPALTANIMVPKKAKKIKKAKT